MPSETPLRSESAREGKCQVQGRELRTIGAPCARNIRLKYISPILSILVSPSSPDIACCLYAVWNSPFRVCMDVKRSWQVVAVGCTFLSNDSLNVFNEPEEERLKVIRERLKETVPVGWRPQSGSACILYVV